MKRTRAWTRYQRKRAIKRKAAIARKIYGPDGPAIWTQGKIGKLSKGKIHCSYWMCRKKSYDELSPSDKRKQVKADQEVEEENEQKNRSFVSRHNAFLYANGVAKSMLCKRSSIA